MTNLVSYWPLWIGAAGVVLAGAVATLARLWIARKDREVKLKDGETNRLIAECQLAVRDLQRFRKLEDVYALELARIKGEKAEVLRKKMRRHEQIKEDDRIGAYGEPVRISKLVRLLDKA